MKSHEYHVRKSVNVNVTLFLIKWGSKRYFYNLDLGDYGGLSSLTFLQKKNFFY